MVTACTRQGSQGQGPEHGAVDLHAVIPWAEYLACDPANGTVPSLLGLMLAGCIDSTLHSPGREIAPGGCADGTGPSCCCAWPAGWCQTDSGSPAHGDRTTVEGKSRATHEWRGAACRWQMQILRHVSSLMDGIVSMDSGGQRSAHQRRQMLSVGAGPRRHLAQRQERLARVEELALDRRVALVAGRRHVLHRLRDEGGQGDARRQPRRRAGHHRSLLRMVALRAQLEPRHLLHLSRWGATSEGLRGADDAVVPCVQHAHTIIIHVSRCSSHMVLVVTVADRQNQAVDSTHDQVYD